MTRKKPFMVWAGGKYRQIPELEKVLPDGARYIEPFVGAGAIALNVEHQHVIINDLNPDLIQVYAQLKSNGPRFISDCAKLFIPENNNKSAFQAFVGEFNSTDDIYWKAVLFVYINRHCFNGVVRYSKKGLMNPPFGRNPYFPKKEFEECLPVVQNFEMYSTDFRQIFDLVQDGDVVYCDPPYLPVCDTKNFMNYHGSFNLQDHLDLVRCAEAAAIKGATVLISNINNWYSKQIYRNARIRTLEVQRYCGSKGKMRTKIKELIAIFKL